MNLCNYAKVILARSTKEPESLNFWNNRNENDKVFVPNHPQNISLAQRHNNYQIIMNKYPKMHMTLREFTSKVTRVQNYLKSTKYWKNGNQNGEKSCFIEQHQLKNWYHRSEAEKKQHSKENCSKCESDVFHASLHKSAAPDTVEAAKSLANLVNNFSNSQSKASNETKAFQVVKTIAPFIEKEFHVEMKDTVAKAYKISTKKSESEAKIAKKITASNKKTLAKIFASDNDEINFLSTNKSLREYERERLKTFYISKSKARQNLDKRYREETRKGKKKRRSVGKLENYKLEKETFIKDLQEHPKEEPINWNEWSRKYKLKNAAGIHPQNGGQVMQEIAKAEGIDIFEYNSEKRISGRDYFRRVRRSRQLISKDSRIPAPISAKKMNMSIKDKTNKSEIEIGIQIAPKLVFSTKIEETGEITTYQTKVYGRMFPITTLTQEFTKEHDAMGIFRDECANKTIERHLKMWHDHSDILNRSYFSVMVQCLYDDKIYISNDEFQAKYPEKKPIDVQSFVEKPKMHIFGQSKSTDVDQLSYCETRMNDILRLTNSTTVTENGIRIHDKLRVFVGDNPARQFEAGHQRGGNYSCICGICVKMHTNFESTFRRETRSIKERVDILTRGFQGKKFDMKSNINPFQGMKKQEIEDELDQRKIKLDERKERQFSKDELDNMFREEIGGIQRPPALLCHSTAPENMAALESYEISNCEPLHDITNVVQNLLVELPLIFEDQETQKAYQTFKETTVGDKNQIKGSDARLFAVKLAHFSAIQYKNGNINYDILTICTCLVDIISICYSKSANRTPKQVLRLYNQCFLFGYLVYFYVGKPKKLGIKKFYGAHYHSLVTHFPEMYRLFCLRSLIPETEERTFGDLKQISLRTSNRQAKHVVDNCMIRLKARETNDEHDLMDSFRRQESAISKQAKMLAKQTNSIIPRSILEERIILAQCHCERIADFLVPGKDVWWTVIEGGHIEFFDGPDETDNRSCGPELHHFPTSNLKREYEYRKSEWQTCAKNADEKKHFVVPCLKIKLYDDDGKLRRTFKTGLDLDEESEGKLIIYVNKSVSVS